MKANITAELAKLFQMGRDIFWPGREIENNCRSLLFHRQSQLSARQDVTLYNSSGVEKNKDLIRRITGAYQRANKADLGNSMWKGFFCFLPSAHSSGTDKWG